MSRLLRTLADTLKAWAYATKAMVWRRQAQAQSAQGTPSSVLDAFLQRQGNTSEKPKGSTNATQNGGETRYHTASCIINPKVSENVPNGGEGV